MSNLSPFLYFSRLDTDSGVFLEFKSKMIRLDQKQPKLQTEPVIAHGSLHPAHHEGHVVGGEGGEEQVCQLGGAHHREP